MIANLLVDSDIAETASDVQPDFAQHHALQIGVCLRTLVSGQDFVTVEFGGRQMDAAGVRAFLPRAEEVVAKGTNRDNSAL